VKSCETRHITGRSGAVRAGVILAAFVLCGGCAERHAVRETGEPCGYEVSYDKAGSQRVPVSLQKDGREVDAAVWVGPVTDNELQIAYFGPPSDRSNSSGVYSVPLTSTTTTELDTGFGLAATTDPSHQTVTLSCAG
jgi:hypothetical protein